MKLRSTRTINEVSESVFYIQTGASIRLLRETKRLTQKEVAVYLHLSQSTYSRKENGSLAFSLFEVGMINDLCGLSVKELCDVLQ